MNQFDITLYNDEFFDWHLKYARQYSIKTMDWFLQHYAVNSVVDFGCGIGSYLESAYNNGIQNLKGYDIGGDAAKKYTPEHIRPFIEYLDCTQPLKTKKYSCVISFETAEHIEPSGTDTFVKNICNATDKTGLILFTAAPPGQEGCGHINCEPKQFWIDKFAKHNFTENTAITNHIANAWQQLGAPAYICSNLIVFKK